MERWVQGCAAQMGRLFGLSGLLMTPFYLKIGLDIGCGFEKKKAFNDFFFLWLTLPIGVKKYLCIPIYMVKSTDLFKKSPSRKNRLDTGRGHRLQISVFSGLIIGWWLKFWAGHPYPTQI